MTRRRRRHLYRVRSVEHTDFARAFTSGARFLDPTDGRTWEVDVVAVGDLSFPTGRVAISDPGYLLFDTHPDVLDRIVPPGRWPCDISIVGGTVAAMRVRFADGPAVRWEPARLRDDGELYGFGVDGGMMTVFDADALEHSTGEQLEQVLDADPPRDARVFKLRPGAEYFVSWSGKGDGGYPAWWGLTAGGAPAELIVEFDVLVYTTTTTFELPLSSLPPDGPVLDPQLAMEGISVEVVSPDEVLTPSIWDVPDHILERMTEQRRRQFTDPEPIAMALRVSSGGRTVASLSVLDATGAQQPHSTSGAVHVSGDATTYYWTQQPAFDGATTLQVAVRKGPFPMPPAK